MPQDGIPHGLVVTRSGCRIRQERPEVVRILRLHRAAATATEFRSLYTGIADSFCIFVFSFPKMEIPRFPHTGIADSFSGLEKDVRRQDSIEFLYTRIADSFFRFEKDGILADLTGFLQKKIGFTPGGCGSARK